jgi:hypothetical protein
LDQLRKSALCSLVSVLASGVAGAAMYKDWSLETRAYRAETLREACAERSAPTSES